VTVTPEERSKMVLSRGILMGLKKITLWGGHACPNSGVGEILLWKKLQKNETKKKISEMMNKIIPVFSPFITKWVWLP